MDRSRLTIYGAIAANVGIAATKFVVAAITGSSAMMSEGIHSAVDTGNGLLLLVGTRLSEREATPEHPFGHGKELYFWSLIVGVLIFGLGGGLSAYQGLAHLVDPVPMRDATWNYVVLGIAALFEGSSFAIAMRAFLREKQQQPFWEALHGSKNPTIYTVLAEDGAALLGLAIAATGIFIAHRYDLPMADGAASLVIGLLLASVAVLLIYHSRTLLIGAGIRRDTAATIHAMVAAHPLVCKVGPMLSMYMGPDDILLTLDVQFDPGATAAQVADAVTRLEAEIRTRFARITRIYIESRPLGGRSVAPGSWPAHTAGSDPSQSTSGPPQPPAGANAAKSPPATASAAALTPEPPPSAPDPGTAAR
jgi:cation diffusion facilitator family transporter